MSDTQNTCILANVFLPCANVGDACHINVAATSATEDDFVSDSLLADAIPAQKHTHDMNRSQNICMYSRRW